ncbi:hypothetical protein BD779DRAFT_1479203 [Infundibulicybe gibba]|nr:hypothetical protein BD779DRAFT_1479203 [Infundibulicybe gibba]
MSSLQHTGLRLPSVDACETVELDEAMLKAHYDFSPSSPIRPMASPRFPINAVGYVLFAVALGSKRGYRREHVPAAAHGDRRRGSIKKHQTDATFFRKPDAAFHGACKVSPHPLIEICVDALLRELGKCSHRACGEGVDMDTETLWLWERACCGKIETRPAPGKRGHLVQVDADPGEGEPGEIACEDLGWKGSSSSFHQLKTNSISGSESPLQQAQCSVFGCMLPLGGAGEGNVECPQVYTCKRLAEAPKRAPVSDLPPEILREIFLHCILLPGEWGSFSSRDTPLVLTKVYIYTLLYIHPSVYTPFYAWVYQTIIDMREHRPSLAASWSPQRWRTRRRHDTFVPFTFPSLALGGGTHDGRAIPWLEQHGVFSDALEWGKRPAGGSGLRFLHDFVVERLGLCSGSFGSLGGYLPFAIRCSSNEHSDERDNRPAHARGVRRDSFEAKEAEVEAAIPLESVEAEAEPEPAGEPERAKLNAGSGKQYSGWQYLMRDPSGLRPQRSALSRRCGAFTAGRVAVVEAGGAGVVVVVAVVVDVAVVVVAAVVGRGDAWAPAESRCMSSDVVGAAGGISTG